MITRKTKQLKNITNVNGNTDNIYRNSNAVYDHHFAQNPVDIFSDELIYVETFSSDNVEKCKLDVNIIIDNQPNHVCEENNTDNNNFVFHSQVNKI